jgi:hypothetical protein
MDYWKKVPELVEALGRKDALAAVKKAIKAVDNIEFVAKKAGIELSQSGISPMVDDILKKLKNVEYKVDASFDNIKEASIAGREKNLLDDQRFVKAILQALEGADPKIIAKVFTAFSKGDNATAGKLLGSIKKKDFN